jgi:hypothetical protein
MNGYRHGVYNGRPPHPPVVPLIIGTADPNTAFETFMDLIDVLGDELNVVIETSHGRDTDGHDDLFRFEIDRPVLKSILYEFEDLLLKAEKTP